jgi:nitrite reductase/ring-hydroxylating ferredoxin subunit
LEGVGLVSERWTSGQLRTTPEQGLVLLDVPTSARGAIASQLAHWNLTVHADSRIRNIVACTGKQFCNIAVTETKAHALQLIEALRKRSLELHGIRIHMSGCPSACANHHTADIGLKGVRVKRLLGTREGFDVFLGGGVAGEICTGLPYRTGVDVGQLPNLIDDIVREYYYRHSPGDTFSVYWRRLLSQSSAANTNEDDFSPPKWECDHCGHQHAGLDPPIYCPQCAALRRHFARLEDGTGDALRNGHAEISAATPPTIDSEGFAVAVRADAVPEGRGLLVRVGDQDLALFRVGGQIAAIDNNCPHAGGSLADGSLADGCVTCPLHGWKFDVTTGTGAEPEHPHAQVASFRTKIVAGQVLIQLAKAAV